MTIAATPAAEAPAIITTDRLRSAALLVAAGLIGFGLILYVAANWDDLGRFGRFWLVGVVIAIGALAALVRPSLQTPGLLLAFAGTGGMLALIGQTYQTGADPWLLFALWAGLTLPWVLVARSDAMWTAWVVVAMTAIVLWQQTHRPFWFTLTDDDAHVLAIHQSLIVAWVLSLGLSALMSSWTVPDRALGVRRWAFRVALVLTLTLIATDMMSAILPSRVRLGPYLLGLACLGGVALALVRIARPDMLLLAATALAIDTALIAGIWRLILPVLDNRAVLPLSLLGIIAALIVAGTVMLLMRLSGGSLAALRATPGAAQPPSPDVAAPRPWPIVLLSGFGALMASIPFIAALAAMLGNFIEKGAGTYVIALIVLPVAIWRLRTERNLFVEQLAAIGLAIGALLVVWGLYRDLPNEAAGIGVGALALAAAIGIGRPWLGALLGAAAALALAIALMNALFTPSMESHALFNVVWSAIAVAGVCAVLAMRARPPTLGEREETVGATTAGWLAAALAGLAIGSGQTFLLGAQFGGGAVAGSVREFAHVLDIARLVSAFLAAGACAWLYRELPSLRSPLAITLMLAAVVLSLVMPGLGATAMVGALAIGLGWRVIGLAAAVGALWIVGAFYYNLVLPLTYKAAILAVVGAVLSAVALASGARLPAGMTRVATAGVGSISPTIARGLVALGLVAVGGLSAQAITSREELIRNGRSVFIELAPVDPRSLMQGDYMALRFRLPDDARRHQPTDGRRSLAIGNRDADGVLRLTRIGDARSELAPDEMMIELISKRGQWIVVTDAWYFKEGTAKKWEAARFGEFRVLPNGRALLVGLADKDRAGIK